MQSVFKKVARLIAEQQFSALYDIKPVKPERFNWVTEIFEGINCKEYPAAPALVWTDGRETITYSYTDMAAGMNRLLNLLRGKGIRQNDVVLTQMSLLPANWTTILAVIKGGFRMIPAATILGVADLVYRFDKLMPDVVVADTENAIKIEAAELRLGKIVRVKILAAGTRPGWLSMEDTAQEAAEAEAAITHPDDPLFLFFTSGTTGMPKIVTHTHMSYPFGHLATASWIGLVQSDLHYNISQPGWAKFAWSSVFAPWNVGAAIFAYHQEGRFNAADQLRLLRDFKITTFCAPPTVLRMLIQEDLQAYPLQLRQCVAAGEPLNPEVIEAWEKGTGLIIRDGYGQTESTCIAANMPGAMLKAGSMGKPTFLYDVVIADDEGQELPPGEEGNITVRTGTGQLNGIFHDYFGEPEKKAQVFRHGLYYTGDKAYKDEDGYIWFVGRDDDVIKSSDYRVGPFEVESVLLEHESVAESAVVGSPHPVKGLEVKAFVVLIAGFAPSAALAEVLFAYSNQHLAPYKMPRIIEFVTELPKTISGKIRRVELRAAEAQRKAKGVQGEQEFFFSRPKN